MPPRNHVVGKTAVIGIGSSAFQQVLILFCVLVMLATYILDLLTPLGMPVWLFYTAPLVLAFWSDRCYAIPTVCLVTVLFLATGLLFSPTGIPLSVAMMVRIAFSIAVIGISALLWYAWRKRATRYDDI